MASSGNATSMSFRRYSTGRAPYPLVQKLSCSVGRNIDLVELYMVWARLIVANANGPMLVTGRLRVNGMHWMVGASRFRQLPKNYPLP